MKHDIPLIVSKVITEINRGDLLIDNEENEDDQGPLEIVFQDGSVLILSLESDGEKIKYKSHNTAEKSLVAQNTTWERVPLTERAPFSSAIGESIIRVSPILLGVHDENAFSLAGINLHISSGDILTYYNAGDFAKIYWNKSPPELTEPFVLINKKDEI